MATPAGAAERGTGEFHGHDRAMDACSGYAGRGGRFSDARQDAALVNGPGADAKPQNAPRECWLDLLVPSMTDGMPSTPSKPTPTAEFQDAPTPELPKPRGWTLAGVGTLILGAYILAGKAGLAIAFADSSVSPVWPASGIAVAALVVTGARLWPAILGGAFFVNFQESAHVASSALIAVGNTLEAVAAAWIVRRHAGGVRACDSARNIVPFVLGAGVLAPMIAATVGVGALFGLGLIRGTEIAPLWSTWWLGDMGGILIVSPALLIWSDYAFGSRSPPVRREEVGTMLVAGAFASLAFFVPWSGPFLLDVSPLLLLPALVWAAYRLGPRATATSVLLVGVIAVAATVAGRGFLVLRGENDSLLLLQVFLSVLSVATLGLAVVRRLSRKEMTANMPKDPALPGTRGRVRASPSLVLFALALLPLLFATAASGAVSRNVEAGLVEARFESRQRSIADAFEDVFERHADRLYGAKGLFESSDEVTHIEFRTFVNVSGWQRTVAGLQGVAFARYLGPNETAAFEERVRADTSVRPQGFPDFSIEPPGNRSDYFVVEYIEPLAPNQAALGFDIGSEAARREAIDRAIATGSPAATRALTLVQEAGNQQGILVVLPVYQGGDPGPTGDRYATLLGVVDTVHRLGDVMSGLEADLERMLGPVNFELYDGPAEDSVTASSLAAGAPVYDSDGTPWNPANLVSGRVGLVAVEVFGRPWTLAVERPADLLTPAEASAPWFLLGAGGVLTLALVGFTHYQQDVWRRRYLSIALQQSQQMNEFKSNLLNVASHELNTPISALKLQIYLLDKMFPTEAPPKARDSLALMDRNVNRLAALVGDTLDVARIQSGKLVLRPADVNLRTVIDDALATYRPVADKAQVDLRLESPEAQVVWADGARLSQVLNNLISNAIKFTPPGGRVEITVRETNGEVGVDVRDTGLGMDPDQLARLFQPFSQVHDTSTGKYKGTGLGLYISKSIIEQHGGRLWAESQGRGHGSTFRVTIPGKTDA